MLNQLAQHPIRLGGDAGDGGPILPPPTSRLRPIARPPRRLAGILICRRAGDLAGVAVTRLMRAVVLPGHDGFIEAHYCEVRGMPRSRRQVVFVLAADAPSVVADERAVAVWR